MTRSQHGTRYKKLLKVLIEARERAGLSQLEAARMVGRYRTYVSKVEQGERRIDVIELADLCAAYGLRPSTILQKIGIR